MYQQNRPPDYYAVLGVHSNASQEEIRLAYRREAMTWHPDRNKSPDAPRMMQIINEAYDVLGDPNKRSEYDRASSGGDPEAFAQWFVNERFPWMIENQIDLYAFIGVPQNTSHEDIAFHCELLATAVAANRGNLNEREREGMLYAVWEASFILSSPNLRAQYDYHYYSFSSRSTDASRRSQHENRNRERRREEARRESERREQQEREAQRARHQPQRTAKQTSDSQAPIFIVLAILIAAAVVALFWLNADNERFERVTSGEFLGGGASSDRRTTTAEASDRRRSIVATNTTYWRSATSTVIAARRVATAQAVNRQNSISATPAVQQRSVATSEAIQQQTEILARRVATAEAANRQRSLSGTSVVQQRSIATAEARNRQASISATAAAHQRAVATAQAVNLQRSISATAVAQQRSIATAEARNRQASISATAAAHQRAVAAAEALNRQRSATAQAQRDIQVPASTPSSGIYTPRSPNDYYGYSPASTPTSGIYTPPRFEQTHRPQSWSDRMGGMAAYPMQPGQTVPNSQQNVAPSNTYGPSNGSLEYGYETGWYLDSRTNFVDFVADVVLTIPRHIVADRWVAGFRIRTSYYASYEVLIDNNGYWFHVIQNGNAFDLIVNGYSQAIKASAGANNHMRVVARGRIGWLYINDTFVTELDLSRVTTPGSILVVSNAEPGTFPTQFSQFSIWREH